MKLIPSILTLCCLLDTTAIAATFPSVYEPQRSNAKEGLQILCPADNGGFNFGEQVAPLDNINGDGIDDVLLGSHRAYLPEGNLDDLNDQPFPHSGSSDRTGIVNVVYGTSWMDNSVSTRKYEYEVTTIDASGLRSRAQVLTVSMVRELSKIRPTMPENLTASVVDNQIIILAWERSSIGTPATGFKVYRDGVKVATTTDARYVDSEPAVNVNYRYEVVAYNDDCQKSDIANVYSGISIPVAPAPPASASAIAYGSRIVEVFWSRVALGQTPAVRYELYRNGILIDTLDALSFMDRDLTPGTEYEYNIRSISAFGLRSDDAAIARVTTP